MAAECGCSSNAHTARVITITDERPHIITLAPEPMTAQMHMPDEGANRQIQRRALPKVTVAQIGATARARHRCKDKQAPW